MLMEKGRSILLKAYWSSQTGWKSGAVTEEDFSVAKNEGFMFEYPEFESHDESLKRLELLLENINPNDISNAFLYSLSTRKLEYRSALGSYYYAKAIPKHDRCGGYHDISGHCYICGWTEWSKEPDEFDKRQGLNVLNFERIKWGGVRHDQLCYALFDLEQFMKLPCVKPTSADIEVLHNILDCTALLDDHQKAGKLREIILKKKILKTNKAEISVLLDVLGICGVLTSREYPCYEDGFVDEYHRAPAEHTNDFMYPINRWHAKDGINRERLRMVFGL